VHSKHLHLRGRGASNAVSDEPLEPASDCWGLRMLVGLTQWTHQRLARAGSLGSDSLPPRVEEDSMRFMNDLSGGGSRAREAARSIVR
jgi:hypothetical protein